MYKILIVEDEKAILDLIKMNLQRVGYQCECASNGKEGADLLAENDYDLVLLDIMLPHINGYELLEYIEPLGIPVIFVTAKGSIKDRVKGLHMGADDYLVKPFFRDELLARVHSLLRRYLSLGSASDNSGNLLQYYELTLNTELKKLYVRGDEIRLTATEYKIMSLLLSRPGRIFPAEEIYERVWEQDSYSVENTVMIHINRLRKKIELNPKKPEYLKVVWGIGYKIEK